MKNLVFGFGSRHDAQIRDAKAPRRNLHPLLWVDANAQLLGPGSEVVKQFALKLALIAFAHVSFEDLPVDVIAIGPIRRAKILFNRNERRRFHIL